MRDCPTCGVANVEHARFCQSCGTALSENASKTAPATEQENEYGGFWLRVAAFIIDGLIVIVGTTAVMSTGFIVAVLAAPWLYEALMTSSAKQATLGKMAVGLVVTDMDGERLTFPRATGRHFAKYLSVLTVGIGFIMVAFTDRRQGLHDMVADTLVIKGSR